MNKQENTKKKKKLCFIKACIPMLQMFVKASSAQRKRAIRKLNLPCINLILECCFNVIFNLNLTTKKQKQYIQKHFNIHGKPLETLCRAKINVKDKKKMCSFYRNYIASMISMTLPILENLK